MTKLQLRPGRKEIRNFRMWMREAAEYAHVAAEHADIPMKVIRRGIRHAPCESEYTNPKKASELIETSYKCLARADVNTAMEAAMTRWGKRHIRKLYGKLERVMWGIRSEVQKEMR